MSNRSIKFLRALRIGTPGFIYDGLIKNKLQPKYQVAERWNHFISAVMIHIGLNKKECKSVSNVLKGVVNRSPIKIKGPDRCLTM